jgi:dienelactone hydrolase
MGYPHFSSDCGIHHDLVADFDGPRPRIIVLCGSTRFREEFHRINRELTKQGVIVLAPGVFGHSGDPLTEEDKERLDALHLRKIDLADEVFVVNPATAEHPDGYIGESTSNEITYARKLDRPVHYLNTPTKAVV